MENTYQNKEIGLAASLFIYLVKFFSLGFLATGIGAILFQLVNKFVNSRASEALYYGNGYAPYVSQEAARYGVASVIVAGIIFFIISYYINKFINTEKIEDNNLVRKWLTYIVLFIAVAVMIVDLVMLIFRFLDGEIATGFALKLISVLAIAGSVFGYYLYDLRQSTEKRKTKKYNKIWFIISIVVSVIVLISAFSVIDNPSIARAKKIDMQIINRLSSIKYSAEDYYRRNSKLPEKIEDLEVAYKIGGESDLVSYKKLNDKEYELCAEFKTETDKSVGSYIEPEWDHVSGKKCFQKKIPDYIFDELKNKTSSSIKPLTQ